MEFSSHIGINIGANVGLHPDAINSTITGTDSPNAGTYDHAGTDTCTHYSDTYTYANTSTRYDSSIGNHRLSGK